MGRLESDPNFLFIIGNPRSGTSLLRIMMTSHPNVTIPPESGFVQWWYDKYKNWDESNATDRKKIKEYLTDLRSSKKIETWTLNFNELYSLIKRKKPANYSELSKLVYIQYSKQKYNSEPPEFIGDKNNYYLHHLPLLDEIFPKAKYLHIVRDGRDVACSYKKTQTLNTSSEYRPNLPTDISEIAEEWTKNNKKILEFFSSFKKDRSYLLKFENLIKHTKEELKEICKFLNLDFSPRMLEYYKMNRKENLEPEETLDWKKKTLDPPDPSVLKKYRQELNESEIKEFEKIANNLLRELGYG